MFSKVTPKDIRPLQNVQFCPPSLPNGIYFSVYSIGVKSVFII